MAKSLKTAFIIFVLVALCLAAGCRARTRDVSGEDVIHYDESYDFSDKKKIVNTLVESLKAFPPENEKPTIIVYRIKNMTDEHIDTNLITDDFRTELFKSGKYRLVNEALRDTVAKEKSYQQYDDVTNETKVKRARQVGARYMLTGSLNSMTKKEPRQVRPKKRTLKYYSLNLQLTDIETGLLAWTDKVEVIRLSSKPFIGW